MRRTGKLRRVGNGTMSSAWRKRSLYGLMSLFVAWHIFALAIVPAPPASQWAQSLQAVVHPYVTVFRLNESRDSHGPSTISGQELRYSVRAPGGKMYDFDPNTEFSRYDPAFWWFRAWYDAVLRSPRRYGDHAGTYFCRKHRALNPIGVTLEKV